MKLHLTVFLNVLTVACKEERSFDQIKIKEPNIYKSNSLLHEKFVITLCLKEILEEILAGLIKI